MICEAEEVKFETNLVQFPSDSKPENLEIDDHDRSILHHHHPSMYTSLSRSLDKKNAEFLLKLPTRCSSEQFTVSVVLLISTLLTCTSTSTGN